MAKQKKLNSNEINKNSSIQISHSINRIKENERKYTIILVAIFMAVFIVVGYISLTVSNKYLGNYTIDYVYDIALNSTSVTLSFKNILSDEEGLKSKPYSYALQNARNNKISYRVKLVEDTYFKEKCGCEEHIDYNLIKYSVDGKTVKTFTDSGLTVYEGDLNAFGTLQKEIRFWISEETTLDKNQHFHGKLIIEELK